MGDAEIIPIGTRGRPGRGTGTRPSAAARSLAPNARRGAARPDPAADEPAGETSDAATGEPAEEQAVPAGQPAEAAGQPAGTAAVPRAEVREPQGIPVGDWLEALQLAAREVFGEQWSPSWHGSSPCCGGG